MSLTEISTIASIASSFAVAASLVYLALQTHQNAKHTKALVWNTIEDRNVNIPLAMADENLCRAYIIENGGEATPEAVRHRQCTLMYSAIFSNFLDLWRQGEMGIVERTGKFTRARQVERLRAEPSHREFVKAILASEAKDMPPYMKRMFAYYRGVIEEAERPA
ncbi:MAG: hypothetical protein JOZ55_06540 [Alphaproteobacteria bacterium]|nr:hypothetical protein [Alphaproteobacteria bacterium]